MGRWYITGDITNMKRISLFAAVVICLSMLFVACSKDDKTENSGGTGNIESVATFTGLNSFIGRTDIDAVKTAFRNAGYALEERGGKFSAEKRDLTTMHSYQLETENGMIVHAVFEYGEDGLTSSGRLKSIVLDKINEERYFSAGNTLKSYHAMVYNGASDQHSFSTCDEFVAWLNANVLSSEAEGESECTYNTYGTSVDIYPDTWGISVDLK